MEFNIPLISADSLPITLEDGDRLFIVGANGSGKSALIQHLVTSQPKDKTRRIAAHRQTWLHSGSIDITPRGRKDFAQNSRSWEAQDNARWMERDGQTRQLAVLFDLIAADNTQARSTRSELRQVDPKNQKDVSIVVEKAQKEVPLFERLNALLALGTLTVSIENSNDEEILARHGANGARFSIAQMSDGERNAALIAAEVLTVEPGTVMLIDEPERHLHRSIIEPFFSALFERRKDCAFVVSTHEVALPVANPEARILIIRSCDWNGDKADKWDAELLEANMPLPEDLKRAILGARRKILFVEGTVDSLDQPLYSALFPDILVEPKGSCGEVKEAVIGLRKSYDLHHADVFGLIDRDDRDEEDDIKKLSQDGVFALDVYSVEGLYCCSDVIEAVAREQAKELEYNADEMIKEIQQKVLSVLSENGFAELMAARRCERRVRNSILSKISWQQIKNNPTINITQDAAPVYEEELNCFKGLLAEKNLDGLFARYPLHKSRILDTIGEALKFLDGRIYARKVVTKIQKDSDLAQKLKDRIRPLAEALDAEVMETSVP